MDDSSSVSLSRRDLALLRAIAGHRCEIIHTEQELLLVDGRLCCDSDACRRMLDAGLITRPGLGSGRWPARLTATGERTLRAAA